MFDFHVKNLINHLILGKERDCPFVEGSVIGLQTCFWSTGTTL